MTRHEYTLSREGLHRALTANDLKAAARRREHAASARHPDIKAGAKRAAFIMLHELRDLRLMIGADGHKLP